MHSSQASSPFSIRNAREADVPTILQLTRELAEYERLLLEVVAMQGVPLTTVRVSLSISP